MLRLFAWLLHSLHPPCSGMVPQTATHHDESQNFLARLCAAFWRPFKWESLLESLHPHPNTAPPPDTKVLCKQKIFRISCHRRFRSCVANAVAHAAGKGCAPFLAALSSRKEHETLETLELKSLNFFLSCGGIGGASYIPWNMPSHHSSSERVETHLMATWYMLNWS
jgi:hypothetical protein